jgi:hypothetical protein
MLIRCIRFEDDCCNFIGTASSCSFITSEILWLAEQKISRSADSITEGAQKPARA